MAFTKDYSDIVTKFKSTICEEINVKDIYLLNTVNDIANVEYLPNYKTLGQKYGNQVKEINELIRSKKFTLDDNKYILFD